MAIKTFELEMNHSISLRKTFDIEIPALEWIPLSENFYKTLYIINNKKIEIKLTKKQNSSLLFSWKNQTENMNNKIISNITSTFAFFMDKIDVGTNPILLALQKYYSDVCYMKATPFNSLLVTILSQNKTGEATRRAFSNLLYVLQQLSPEGILRTKKIALENAIRIAGPYKVKYLIKSSEQILSYWGGNISQVVELPTDQALSSLIKLPGVSYKTAACVLVFSALKKDIVPIDTHLLRVTQRLGLINIKNKSLTSSTYMQINTCLKSKIPDAGYAHLLFVMLGRDYCYARNPVCNNCPLLNICPRINI